MSDSRFLVVGAGIVGSTTALEFARRGYDVDLFDQHDGPFQGSTGAAFGSLTPYSDPFFTGNARRFAERGTNLYRERWAAEIAELSGKPIHFGDDGLIELCPTMPDFHEKLRVYNDLLTSGTPAAQALDANAIRKLEPAIDMQELAGGILLNEPWIDLESYLEGLSLALSRESRVTFHRSEQLTAIRPSTSGVTLTCGSGQTYSGDFAILATGLGPTPIDGCPNFPLEWLRGDAVRVYTPDNKPILKRHIYLQHAFITPRPDGRMLLGSTYTNEQGVPSDHDREYRNRATVSQVIKIIDWNANIVSRIHQCELGEVWRGWRPSTPDEFPILGPLPMSDRCVVATGFKGLGVTMAPATALTIAEYCLGVKSEGFPPEFDPTRATLTS
jgi:glycine/D-amino acid oxidase-like deaminating enzyme